MKGKCIKSFRSQIFTNGNKIDNSKDICECFDSYFTNIGVNLSRNTNNSKDPLSYINSLNNPSFYFTPTNQFEILKTNNNLKITNPVYDDMLPKIIKQISTLIALPLTHIINTSLVTGVVPSKFKIAKVIPIFITGQCHDMCIYRPMSILPSLSKIMEKIIANHLFSFLEKFNILCKYQFGFIPNKNATHAISTLVDYVINSLENNKTPSSIFLDTSKAFDTIDHKILLNKLYMYGIRGITHNWFKNYLSERHQYVSINNCSSSLQKIKCGVPQDSILGPILFLLCINDLPNASNILRF